MASFLMCVYVGLIYLTYKGMSKTSIDDPFAYSSFVPILSKTMNIQYNSFKKGSQKMDILFWIRTTVGSFLFYARCNVIKGFSDGPFFKAAVICGLIALLSFLVFTVALAVAYLLDLEDAKRPNESLRKWAQYLRDNYCSGIAEEGTVIFGVLALGFSLYARAVMGLCPEGASWLETARCNPAAASNGLPMDHVMYICMYAILVPVTVRAVRFEVNVFNWFVGVGFVIASAIHVQAGMEGWMMVAMMVLSLTLAFENERYTRQSFLDLVLVETRNKAVLAAQAEVAEVERQRVEQKAIHEKELATREQAQLVALIGNVAHDLVG